MEKLINHSIITLLFHVSVVMVWVPFFSVLSLTFGDGPEGSIMVLAVGWISLFHLLSYLALLKTNKSSPFDFVIFCLFFILMLALFISGSTSLLVIIAFALLFIAGAYVKMRFGKVLLEQKKEKSYGFNDIDIFTGLSRPVRLGMIFFRLIVFYFVVLISSSQLSLLVQINIEKENLNYAINQQSNEGKPISSNFHLEYIELIKNDFCTKRFQVEEKTRECKNIKVDKFGVISGLSSKGITKETNEKLLVLSAETIVAVRNSTYPKNKITSTQMILFIVPILIAFLVNGMSRIRRTEIEPPPVFEELKEYITKNYKINKVKFAYKSGVYQDILFISPFVLEKWIKGNTKLVDTFAAHEQFHIFNNDHLLNRINRVFDKAFYIALLVYLPWYIHALVSDSFLEYYKEGLENFEIGHTQTLFAYAIAIIGAIIIYFALKKAEYQIFENLADDFSKHFVENLQVDSLPYSISKKTIFYFSAFICGLSCIFPVLYLSEVNGSASMFVATVYSFQFIFIIIFYSKWFNLIGRNNLLSACLGFLAMAFFVILIVLVSLQFETSYVSIATAERIVGAPYWSLTIYSLITVFFLLTCWKIVGMLLGTWFIRIILGFVILDGLFTSFGLAVGFVSLENTLALIFANIIKSFLAIFLLYGEIDSHKKKQFFLFPLSMFVYILVSTFLMFQYDIRTNGWDSSFEQLMNNIGPSMEQTQCFFTLCEDATPSIGFLIILVFGSLVFSTRLGALRRRIS